MVGLGVLGDQPVDPLQPILPDGIHLRWGFDRELGFPWYGFHLFRRPSRRGIPWCLSAVTGGLAPGTRDETRFHTAIGRLSSDTPLVLTEKFAPGAQAEFALDGRAWLRFDLPEGEAARRVDLRIGLRPACVTAENLLSTSAEDPKAPPDVVEPGGSVSRPNPLAVPGLTFTVKGASGQPAAQIRFDSIATTAGQLVGLACGYGLTILLPGPCNGVELLVTPTITTTKFEAFNAGGQRVANAATQNPANQPETIRLAGEGMVRIEVRTLRNTAFLHRICLSRAASEGVRIAVTAFSGATPVRTLAVQGAPGQIVSASVGGDAITAVEIGPGAAVLVDLCYVPVAQDAAKGWEPLRGFPYPMGLPVSHSDYPCSAAAPASLPAQRVRYALPPEWSATSFAELHQQLVELVKGGPAGAPMTDRAFSAPAAVSTPPDPDPPALGSLQILDMVLLGALHPALAQLAGLYWVDQTAAANTAYDYLVVADHTGVGQRSAATVLAVLQSSGFAQLDGWITFNQRVAPAAPLPPPGTPQAYALPGGTFPDAQGQIPLDSNHAGLRWDLGWDATGALLPERAVMYLVWRAALGNVATPAPGGTPALITKVPSSGKPKPVMVTQARLPKGAVPQRPPGWPPDPLHYIDRNLPDGWYRYQVSGIDLFGRHSAGGPPAQLLLRDSTPPPMPTGVQAHALDPLDPHLQKNAAYDTWRAAIGSSVVGLRVRWIWTPAHQRQAPDTAEFRIYYHPGAIPHADRDQPLTWQDRWFTVAYGSGVTIDPLNGDRVYEVFIPPPGTPNLASIPLAPSLAEPVVYAHVGVSAADGKPHTTDARTGGDWANRPGNEGSVGAPAKIYRVWREIPAPPAALMNDARYYASPADYHDRSFFTYRWKPEPLLKLHVFRAMDDALFQADWALRPASPQLSASQADLFPPDWNQAGRQQVVDELNHLDTLVAAPGADADAVATAATTAMAYYGQLSDAALRVLAGLPENEGAFAQLTIQPLDPAHLANADHRGPDNADDVVIDPPNVRAYVDTLDGRATNRYFYRAALVDGAHNLGPLGPSTPPVYLPRVVPPRTPMLTRIRGGERQIELRWVRGAEVSLAAYRVYRTRDAVNTRDIRLMEMVAELPAASLVVNQNEVRWTDDTVPAGTNFYYRVTALDAETRPNESPPSNVVVGRAVDTALPQIPEWLSAEWVLYDASGPSVQSFAGPGAPPPPYQPAVQLVLDTDADLCSVYRRIDGENTWRIMAAPPAQNSGSLVLFDVLTAPDQQVSYRAVARNHLGIASPYTPVVVVAPVQLPH